MILHLDRYMAFAISAARDARDEQPVSLVATVAVARQGD